jgi:hypothetical protein
MTNDLDPRRHVLQHILQYGALGMVAAFLLAFFLWWAKVQVVKDSESRKDEAEARKAQTAAFQQQVSVSRETKDAIVNVNANLAKLNEQLIQLRITGRRKPRTTDGE